MLRKPTKAVVLVSTGAPCGHRARITRVQRVTMCCMVQVILVSGSMVAGKSTVSQVVVDRLRARGLSVAFTALDVVADMARPTLPDWEWAHDIHARVVGLWAATGIDVVVDEGTSSVDEVRAVLARLPPGTPVLHVTLVGDYDTALGRARADPTRGISKDPAFLRGQYDHFATQLPLLDADLVLEVADRTPDQLAEEVLEAWDSTVLSAPTMTPNTSPAGIPPVR